MGGRFLSWGKAFRAWSWPLRLRMSGTIPLLPFPHIPWWQGQGQLYLYILCTLWYPAVYTILWCNFSLSSRKSLNIRRKFGRSSLPIHPAEIGTDAGISKPTAYKQNLTQLQQITEVPSVVSSHIPGTSVRSWYLKLLRKCVNFFFGHFPFALQICEDLICKLFICHPPDLLRSVTGNWNHQFCCQTFPSKRWYIFLLHSKLPCRICNGTVVAGQKCRRRCICSTHISEVVVFLKKTVAVILSVTTVHHKVILGPRRSAWFTVFVSVVVTCSVCCELPHICKWNQWLV